MCGLVDKPDARRKIHPRPVPLAGGPALAVALLAAAGMLWFLEHPLVVAWVRGAEGKVAAGIAAACAILLGVGIADDYGWVRGRHKLLAQLLAVGLVLLSGVVVRRVSLFGFEWELHFLAYPLTAFWLVGAINAYNLLDGMDGLVGVVSLTACLAAAAIGWLCGDGFLTLAGLALAGAVLVFLCYNWPPATVFLGDSGSMMLGLLLGLLALRAAMLPRSGVVLAPATALVFVPVLDTAAAILRRSLTGRSLYAADRGHIHHVLLRRGFSVVQVLGILGGLAGLGAAAAVASKAWNHDLPALATVTAAIVFLAATGWFGRAELELVLNQLRHSLLAWYQPRPRQPRQLEIHLQGTADWRELWQRLTDFADTANLQSIRLDVSLPAMHEEYHARWDRPLGPAEPHDLWVTTIPLTLGQIPIGRLEIRAIRDHVPVSDKLLQISRFVEEIEKSAASMVRCRAVPADGSPEPAPMDATISPLS
jgi:UDP-GlcNAc:undecaprenyl-phosphate GlcNAc-1-phosphate transferase